MTSSNQNRAKNLIVNTFILSFGNFLPKVMSLITLPILTSKLTTTEFGSYDLIETLISFLLPLVTLQISSAGFRFIIQEKDNKIECSKIITNILTCITVSSILSVFILFIIFHKINLLLLLITICYFLVDIFNNFVSQIVRGFSKNKIYSFSTIINSVMRTILICLLLLPVNLGLLGTIISLLISTLFSLMYQTIKIKLWRYVDFKYISKNIIKKLLSYSWPLIPNSLSLWILNVSDRVVITYFLGIDSNAIYAVANKIPNLLTTLNSTFSMAWQENASINVNSNDINEYYSKMFEAFIRFIAGGCVLIISATPILFKILMKGNYQASYYQMPILFIAIFYSCLSSFLGGIYIANKKTKSVGITTLISAFINLSIDLLLIKLIGITAGSISTLISYMFIVFFRMHDIKKFHNIKYNINLIFIINVLLLIMSGICFINNFYLNIFNILFSCIICYIFNKKIIHQIINKIIVKIKC